MMFHFLRKGKVMRSFFALVFFLALLSWTYSLPLFAEREIAYDPYSSILKYPEAVDRHAAEQRGRNQFFARILEQPIRPIGYSLGKTAEWVERNHMDDKTIWLFDELASHGIHVKTMSPTESSFGTIGLEGRIELE